MGALKKYIETIFAEFPKTADVLETKEELLTTMEDRYTSLCSAGRSEKVAIGIVIGEYGLVDELKESLHIC
ncbi:hypothetical protein [Enterococcus sp. AZ109]|uniref:hypothetical protein n=1 Tax=Enterococcus sp. AZ109 TaxID=2774634 RepID=UPI003F231BE9